MQRSFAQLPNVLSALRLLLIAPIVVALARRHLQTTLILFLVASASDAADGFLARRFGWQTPLGAVLDPLADKLLVAALFVALATMGCVPSWLTAAVVGRDLLIVGGGLAYRFWIGPVGMRPTAISKLNTLCQLSFLALVVAQLQFQGIPPWIGIVLGALVFVTVVISGLDYVLTYSRCARDALVQRRTPLPT